MHGWATYLPVLLEGVGNDDFLCYEGRSLSKIHLRLYFIVKTLYHQIYIYVLSFPRQFISLRLRISQFEMLRVRSDQLSMI